MRLRIYALLSGLLFVSQSQAGPAEDYLKARQAQQRGDEPRYQRLRAELADYPLASYLDYFQLKAQVATASPEDIRQFLRDNPDSPLGAFLVERYQKAQAEKGAWQKLLALSDQVPSDGELKCHYYHAQWRQGDKALALEGARELWLSGRSQPKACDPLFKAWRQAGHLDTELVLRRMEAAFKEGQGSLMSYLMRYLHGRDRNAGQAMLNLFRSPDKAANGGPRLRDEARRRRLVMLAVERLARRRPQKAWQTWMQARQHVAFGWPQKKAMARGLIPRLMSSDDAKAADWRDQALTLYRFDDLLERRIRKALAENDSAQVRQWLLKLSRESRDQERWQYWLARTDGDATLARSRLEAIAGNRSYYGFLAAQELGLPYAFNEAEPAQPDAELLAEPALARIRELKKLDMHRLASLEWQHLLSRHDSQARQALGSWALAEGYHNLAVWGAIRGDGWDLLKVRFPVAFAAEFKAEAEHNELPLSLLLALARQESALDPHARSHVGAMGLMQLMPATARRTAKKAGMKLQIDQLYRPEVNVKLGSRYYKEMLARFDNNRFLAAAAYNAGPHRVDRWLGKGVDAQAFVETIPFKETRQYVQSVLAYNLIYQHRTGLQPGPLLTPQELAGRY
ncbi:transglycosylase SLT domain-containing protein [Gallaecimonas sp. GXIMD4217]|uniref:transglycosylase SLT domain-containing protein n=1 Tax=Gallaecimonas sp. GXIMD4217 TaxID=3131927 RepID=UPI00311AFA9F